LALTSTMSHFYVKHLRLYRCLFPGVRTAMNSPRYQAAPDKSGYFASTLSPIYRTLLNSPAIYRGAGYKGRSGVEEVEHLSNMNSTSQPVIELHGLTKHFPGVVANDHIFLTLHPGEIQTLLGENGAGKSTLLNILSGMIQPDVGQILIDGQAVTLASPHEALKRGIGTVYQHFTLVPTLSVLENVILGLEMGFVLNLRRVEQQLSQLLNDFGLPVSPHLEVQHLSLGQQQRVEIIKALFRGSRVLLLDEPTSVLSPPETAELFGILRRLKAQGVAIVFISHKLDEALTLSDRITVLRQGRGVGEIGPEELARQDKSLIIEHIVALMFGQTAALSNPGALLLKGASHLTPKPVCTLDHITALNDRGIPAVREITLELRAGEILGIAGVDGNGQKELAEVLAGQRPVRQGRIMLNGVDVTHLGVSARQKMSISYLSDDRLDEASVPHLSVAENAVLKVIRQPPFSHRKVLNRGAIAAHARRLIEQFNIVAPGPSARLGTLSGGNIQKLLLARELAGQPRLMICNKPTQGLDVLTAQFVLRTLREQADQGMAVMLISAELDELLALSERIGVMYGGRLLAVIPRDRADRETIGRLMLGEAG
jgi:general nucleoside transport system ATP-binding protein